MYKSVIERGSYWLKWDCHVHTPVSYENELADFDTYVDELKKAAQQHEIDVVVINDYFTLDGYKELINKYCEKEETIGSYYIKLDNDKKLYILPGVELRIDNFTDSNAAVNFHVFFNEKLSVSQIEENFLCALNVNKYDKQINLTRDNIVRLGYAMHKEESYRQNLDINNLDEGQKKSYTNLVYKNITLKYKEIINAKERLESLYNNDDELADNCALIVVPFKGHGSVCEIGDRIWEGRAGEIKKEILAVADICYASNQKDIEFLLGINGIDRNKLTDLFRTIKPCIWGSDAHTISNLCHPSNGNTNRYTWIKGIPNFNGIKQILFEPSYRIKVQESKPEIKTDYHVIDKIKFTSEGNIYPSKEIVFNTNLNTIIGGKSSGKSFLLNCLASAINGIDTFQYKKLREKYPFNFEVFWKDGTVDKLDQNEQHTKKVKYINQMYITNFVENNEKLDKEVLDILLENEKVEEIDGDFREKKKDIDDKINTIIFQLEQNIKDINNLNEEALKIGNYTVIEKEIEKLNIQRDMIIKESSMTEQEIKQYSDLLKSRDNLKKDEDIITKQYVELIDKHLEYIRRLRNPIENWLNSNPPKQDKRDTHECFRTVYSNIMIAIDEGLKQLNDKRNEHLDDISSLKNETEKIVGLLQPFENKMKQKEIIDNINKELEEQEKLRKKSLELYNSINEKRSINAKMIDDIIRNLKDRIGIYQQFTEDFIRTGLTNMDQEVKIICNLGVDYEELGIKVNDILNKNTSDNKTLLRNIEDGDILKNDKIDTIRNIIDNSIKKIYLCKGGYNEYNLIRTLTGDYYKFRFDIVSQETSFFDMSPGKQGLILLKLILHMSNEKYPILLDQPEDNLDNRTISTELKEFVKTKKNSRQIFMVTHNANLTVLTDSEEIIVANQRGANLIEQETLFDYVTGPMEFSFIDKIENKVLYKRGIKEHVCEVLEGGVQAFKAREDKYEINRMIFRKE